MKSFKDKIILLTGGSGSWAQELTKQLLEQSPKEIRIFSRGEIAQVNMQRKFNDKRLRFIIGDVRDYNSLLFACKDVNIIFHMAALKHVPIAEECPYEAIKTNILGTENLVRVAIECGVQKVVDVSTDKAAHPINLYGMTKAIGEKLTIHGERLVQLLNGSSNTKFVCIRSGNVMGTNGSVIPHFINQIKLNNKIEITDKEMTRYFLTLPEAIELLLTASICDLSGVIMVTKMPSCKIIDLGRILIKHYGDFNTAEIKEIGIRQGEKLHEVLVTCDEANYTYFYKDDYYVISNKELDLPKVAFKEYTTVSQPLMPDEQIEQMLKDGGFLK